MKELHKFIWKDQQYEIEIEPKFSSDSKYYFLLQLMIEYPDLAAELGRAKKADPDLTIDVKVVYPDVENYKFFPKHPKSERRDI